jgi:hypothetical protein
VALYRHVLQALSGSGIPFLVGGAYALHYYAGVGRFTKDLDVFSRPSDAPAILAVVGQLGWHTEHTFPHWLRKAYHNHEYIDVIHSSGNGLAVVDDAWFENARPVELFGVDVALCPVEEMIWSKAFVMERERFDGADIAHLLRSCAHQLDWARLLASFGRHWRVLYAHLLLFGFIYPGERSKIPPAILRDLASRLAVEEAAPEPEAPLCQGTLLSRAQYLADIESWGYRDGRLQPDVHMDEGDIRLWTAPVREKHD